jgi:N-acetylglucosamine-6-sulfatase
MNRRQFLKNSAAVAAAAAPSLLTAQGKKRNIVVLLSDDHRYDSIGAMGHPWLETPHLDAMLRDGVHIRNAFVTTALCSPSRATCLSSQYVHAHRVMDNSTPLTPGVPTFPEVLQKSGYKTGFIGKWHMGGESDDPRPGFDHWISFRGQGQYFDPLLNFNGRQRKVEGYNPEILTAEAEKFLQANKDRPFMLYLSHKSVHDNFAPAPRDKGIYKGKPIPYPKSYANTDENYAGKPEWVRRQRMSWHGVDGLYNQRYKFEDFYREYCECVHSLDRSIGAFLSALEELGLAEDTLVIYMGDNGTQLGEHGLIDKRTMYETSMRVPMIARCPSLFGKGKAIGQMCLNLDIGPTILDAAGVQAPPTMQGASFLPLLEGKEAPWRTEFVYEYFWERAFPQTPTVIGLRTDQYSYMRYHGLWDVDELYDIQKDPDQMENLIGDVRTINEAGPLINRYRERKHPYAELLRDYEGRIQKIMGSTGGRMEPTWFA